MSKIFLDAPNIGEREKKRIIQAMDAGYVSTVGPFVPEFEQKFAEYVGAKNAVSTQSGTAAIHITLHELGIGQGDEVIVPALTFVATVNPVLYVGATPVIVDVDPETWNICPNEIKKAITKKTKAIIPVHLYGNPCNMDEIMKIAKEHNLYVIEDATESMGSIYQGRQTGTFGDMGCFSFNGNKIITTGGGGMIATNNDKRAVHIKYLVNQARNSDEYYHSEMGFNYRMTNIEAALGLAQLENVDNFLKQKRKYAQIYREELGSISGIEFQSEDKNAKSNF
ncbi:aminotransferase class I/II-fold pyridoxal phosphate-dependent enzyme, partial [bacterium]|nr:aminotransferase class I/II-fold pyridoxal phosphate-dependent enzyme [bacterium]